MRIIKALRAYYRGPNNYKVRAFRHKFPNGFEHKTLTHSDGSVSLISYSITRLTRVS